MNLNELQEAIGLDKEEILELLELFLETCASDLAAMAVAIEEEEYRKVAEAAHSIKGASGNMRFVEIYDLAKDIEADAREKSLEKAMDRANEIGELLQGISENFK